ncbi:MAG: hypothetical protein P8N76_27460 [Pirellulaceae bacterium]|nr:hypothetical protein [Pirellulaceae bacterium]
MRHRSLQFVLLGAASAVCQSASSATISSDSTIDALIARARSIYSVRVDFTLTTKSQNEETQNQYRFSQAGNDWALRYPNSPAILMNTRDATFRFYETTTPSGKIYRALHLTPAQSLGAAIGSNYACAAARVGTFWYDKQLDFIDQNRHQAVILTDQRILGIPTTMLEWPVQYSQLGSAFVIVPGQVDKSFAGFLRIFTAPAFGYAIPRMDYVSAEGKLLRRYEANDFVEIGDSLFFPQVARCISFHPHHRTSTTFSIEQIDFVNTDLPKDEFDLQVPGNARVRDSRPGSAHSVFHLEEQSDLEGIHKLIQQDPNQTSALSFRFLVFAINLLLVTFLIFLWTRQQCDSS